MKIAVIDGQGGGLGKIIIERIKKEITENIEIIALGTNGVAASLMMKAGANETASGENAIIYNSSRVDIILGSLSIIVPNSMLGEVTAKMANAIVESTATKILIPLGKYNNIEIVGVLNDQLNGFVDRLINKIKEQLS